MEKKIVLITGATSGIGEACARRFAKGGFDLILTGRNELRLQAVKEAAEADGAQVKVLRYDVRDRKACREAVESLQGRWACVDVLINNAGLALGLEKEYMGDFEDWDTMIDTNIKGLLTMTRASLCPTWCAATMAMSSTLVVWQAMPLMPTAVSTAPPRLP